SGLSPRELPYDVEMYILLPVLHLVGKVHETKGIVALCRVAVIAACPAARCWTPRHHPVRSHVCGRRGQLFPWFFGTIGQILPFISWPTFPGLVYAYRSTIGFQQSQVGL